MADKKSIIRSFDPSGFATNNNLFGLPFDESQCEIIAFPVPWEVTVSYASGTANGPEAIREASLQVDLYDPAVPDAWTLGIYMPEISEKLKKKSDKYRQKAKEHIHLLMDGLEIERDLLQEVNEACARMVDWVREKTGKYLDDGKLVALVGGDHSTPLGYLQALAERHDEFGVLQIDAHADLRKAYEDFTYSHASISYNFMKLPQISKLVQVGIRDYCEDEVHYIEQNQERIKVFFDRDLKQARFRGTSWETQVRDIISHLPEKVYLSFDIDGLDPKLCPNTGTPVAGGFETDEVLFLVEELIASGRTLIGFDLNEVAPGKKDEWDANVGARLLYRLCNLMGKSNDRLQNG